MLLDATLRYIITSTEGEPVYGKTSHLVKKMHRLARAGCTGRTCLDAQTIHRQMLLILDTDDKFPTTQRAGALALREKLRGQNQRRQCDSQPPTPIDAVLPLGPRVGVCLPLRLRRAIIISMGYAPVPLSPKSRIWPLCLSPGVTGLLKND